MPPSGSIRMEDLNATIPLVNDLKNVFGTSCVVARERQQRLAHTETEVLTRNESYLTIAHVGLQH